MMRWLVGMVLLATTAACANSGASAGGTTGAVGGPSPSMVATLDREAHQALAAYDAVLRPTSGHPPLVPIGPLTSELGSYRPQDSRIKSAVAAGLFSITSVPSQAVAGPGWIRWADGSSTPVALVSAADALREMSGAPAPCPGCTPAPLAPPHLGTMTLATTLGPATVPAWLFSLPGTRVSLARVAVAPADRAAPPVPSGEREGLAITGAEAAADGRTVTVRFYGSRLPASQVCGADYTTKAIESAHAVAVIVYEHPRLGGPATACAAMGWVRTATVMLAAPLGQRSVLEVRTGQVVPVHRG